MVRCFTIWIIRAGKFCLNILYGILKVFPVKPNKVLFLSRQSDELSLDFSMLRDELRREMPDIEIRAICNRLDDSGSGLLGFAADTLRSMYHLASSSVCVLDAYWPAVSMLKPVSYTHLDVYKRQAMGQPGRNLCCFDTVDPVSG